MTKAKLAIWQQSCQAWMNSVGHSSCFYDCDLYRLTVSFCPRSLVFCPFICLLLLHVIPLFFFFFCSVRIDYFKKIIIQNRTLRAYKNTFTYIILILKIHFHFSTDNSSSELSISADQTNSRCLESQVFSFPVSSALWGKHCKLQVYFPQPYWPGTVLRMGDKACVPGLLVHRGILKVGSGSPSVPTPRHTKA